MAPPRHRRRPTRARPRRLSHSPDPHGQTQAHLRPLDRLRRLRSSDKLRPTAHNRQEALPEAIPHAHDATGLPQRTLHGQDDGQVGRRRGAEKGR